MKGLDPSLQPLLLGVGEIRDPHSQKREPWAPTVFVEACQEAAKNPATRGYLLPTGSDRALRLHAQHLIFDPGIWAELGGSNEDIRPPGVVWANTVGGGQAVWLSCDLAASRFDKGERTMVLETPGWPNYHNIATLTGFDRIVEVDRKRGDGGWYDHQRYLSVLQVLPQSVLVLQASGYNGDGIDKTPQQWHDIAEVAAAKGHVVVLDLAYNGLASGFGIDNYAIAAMLEAGVPVYIAASNSKIFGVYGHRCGEFYHVVGQGEKDRTQWANQLQTYIGSLLIRGTTSNPPRLPIEAGILVLSDDDLRRQFFYEIEQIRQEMLLYNRQAFVNVLETIPAIAPGRGLYCTLQATPFTPEQLEVLKNEYAFHFSSSKRVCFGAIPPERATTVASQIKDVLGL